MFHQPSRFYQKAFAFGLRYMHPSNGYAELQTGATPPAFVSEEFVEKAGLLGKLKTRPNRPDLDPVAAQVTFVTDAMDRDWAQAFSAGAVAVKEPEAKPRGQTTGYLRDNDGFIVEPCTRSPRD
jgi:lactoylglutathione lyase